MWGQNLFFLRRSPPTTPASPTKCPCRRSHGQRPAMCRRRPSGTFPRTCRNALPRTSASRSGILGRTSTSRAASPKQIFVTAGALRRCQRAVSCAGPAWLAMRSQESTLRAKLASSHRLPSTPQILSVSIVSVCPSASSRRGLASSFRRCKSSSPES